MKIGILEADHFSLKAINQLKKIGNVEFYDSSDLFKFVNEINILFIRLKYFIGKELLDNSPNLQIICTPTTGLNHIDIEETKKRNIKIISLKNETDFLSNIRATPEHSIGLIISLLRNYKYAFLNSNNNIWNRDIYRGDELFNNKVGIIGFGRVGKLLAKYLYSFSAKVNYYDINKNIKSCYQAQQKSNLKSLIKSSNIVIMCASYHKDYHKYINKKYIDLLRNKYFINTARGELIDEKYLIKKINENYFKGIALDVIIGETQSNNLSLLLDSTTKRNIIVTPHIGGATYQSMELTELFITQKLFDIFKINN